MNRRQFAGAALASLPLIAVPTAKKSKTCKRDHKTIRPGRLTKGDTIGVITPGSFLSDEGLQKAVTNIESLGFTVKLSKNIRKQHGYIAGTDAERLEDIHAMFEDSKISGIWCARGGYGTGRLLPKLNYKLIKRHPKPLIGYSDITALLNGIYSKTGLVGFHGPVGASDFTDYAVEHLRKTLMQPQENYTISPFGGDEKEEKHEVTVIRQGSATGKIVGGNLSLLAAAAGTPYEPNYKNKIVFIEDVGEKPYRIDRMLTQLRQAGKLHHAAGILLGRFNDCEAKEDDLSLTLAQTLTDRLGDLGIPVLSGFSFGHISNQITIPIGTKVTMNTKTKTLTIINAGVR